MESMSVAGGTGEHFELWNEVQQKYVKLRIDGATMGEAAAACEISPNTATNWEKHRPKLKIREAIEAGWALRDGLGSGAAAEHVVSQVGQVCRQIVTEVANVEIAKYAEQAQLGLNAVKVLERNMFTARRAADQNQAAIALLKLLEVKVTVDTTMSASEVTTKGLSDGGKTAIEENLLGVNVRSQVWQTIRVAENDS